MFRQVSTWLNNTPIAYRLGLGFGVLAVLLVVMGVVALVTANIQNTAFETTEDARAEQSLAQNILTELLAARGDDREFRANYYTEGYDTAFTNYVVPYQQHIQNAKNLLGELREGEAGELAEEVTFVDQIEQAIIDYDEAFMELVENDYLARGNAEAGLVAALIDSLEELDDAMEAPGVPEEVSEETDEILVASTTYIYEQGAENIDTFRTAIAGAQADLQEDDEISASLRTEISDALAAALVAFDALIEQDEEIVEETAVFTLAAEKVQPLVQDFVEDEYDEVVEAEEAVENAQNIIQLAQLGGLAVALLLAAALAWLISRPLVRQVNEIEQVFQAVGMGEFDARARIYGHDELGRTAEGVNAMLERLTDMLETTENDRAALEQAIEHLVGGVSELASGDLSVDLDVAESSATRQVADALNYAVSELRSLVSGVGFAATEVTTASNAMTDVMQLMSEQASQSAGMAEQAAASTQEGDRAVEATINAMDRIRDNTQDTARRMKRLGEASQEISEVVRFIEELTDRTTVLALNASIQAAAAGDAGRGFAVVAEEVQHLAERSAGATRQIEGLVKSIQTETNETSQGVDEAIRAVVDGSQLAQEAGVRVTELNDLVNDLAGLVQQTAETTSVQTNLAVSNLAGLAHGLQESVAVFNVAGDALVGTNGDRQLAAASQGGNGSSEQAVG